ncbi:rhythmically expressed gene 5 protein [Chrysoperla carnea]|uniref:rhythmically expressed gene 5 protein n=1 Tax=Chrysoperla carnea TaxID=189513 RepID=UPI001D07393C|nr:rhythmically expressed gene 5 protein [Chrysoperla carnea]
MAFIKHIFVCLCVISLVASSAIPMWEMLGREEKMAYLYAQFINQVEDFCSYSQMSNCRKELTKHGLAKLHSMPEDHLDLMDPFQRGAHNIIWDSMMDGHEVLKKSVPETPTTTTAAPTTEKHVPAYAFLTNPPRGGARPQRVSSIQDQIQEYQKKKSSSNYLENDLYTETNYLNTAASSKFEKVVPVTNDFVGPMVVRVKPDGTYVDTRVPIDEDLIHYKMAKTKVPSMLDTLVDALRPVRSTYESQPYAVYVKP